MSQLKIFKKIGKTKLGRGIIKGGATLATGVTLITVGTACNPEDVPVQIIVEDPNPVTNPGEVEVTKPGEEVSDKPGDVVEPVEPEEVKEEIDRYAQVPEEELDENGKYIPVDVTADMLRERFEKIEKDVEPFGYGESYVQEIESTIMKSNYPYISDEDFKTIIDEYDIDLTTKNYCAYYNESDVAPEDFFFDPYLQYENRVLYDIEFEKNQLWRNNGKKIDENNQAEVDVLNKKFEDLVNTGRYESDDEKVYIPFEMDGDALGSKYEKDTNISICYLSYQYLYTCENLAKCENVFSEIINDKQK